MILKPVRDLLIIVETALLKVYLIYSNNTLANALLRNQDNCCLPSEIEKELNKHHLRTELVSFYEKQKRHDEALRLITNTKTASTNYTIVNYLSKLDNDQLELISRYIKPMLKTALVEKDNELLADILTLFIGESSPTSPSTSDASDLQTIKLDPLNVYELLKEINQDFSIKYLENICLKPELGTKKRDVHNLLVYAYCDRIKRLSTELKPLIKEEKRQTKNDQQYTYQGNSSHIERLIEIR